MHFGLFKMFASYNPVVLKLQGDRATEGGAWTTRKKFGLKQSPRRFKSHNQPAILE